MQISKLLSVLLISSSVLFLRIPTADAQITKKGVNLFYLDGVSQDLWAIASGVNSGDPVIQGKLRSGLALLQSSGVNSIRLLIGARGHYYPQYSDAQAVALMNNLMTFIDGATTPANAFTYEMIFVTDTNAANVSNPYYFKDPYPFTNDVALLKYWIDNLTSNKIYMYSIAGDFAVCNETAGSIRCAGDGYNDVHDNYASWMTTVYPQIVSAYPGKIINYAVDTGYSQDPGSGPTSMRAQMVVRSLQWMKANTPNIPFIEADEYPSLPGEYKPTRGGYQSYANDVAKWYYLTQYGFGSPKQVWREVYGIDTAPDGASSTEKGYALQGILTGLACQGANTVIGTSYWTSFKETVFGMTQSFGSTSPYAITANPEWTSIANSYASQSCTQPTISSTAVVTSYNPWAISINGSGFNSQSFLEIYDTSGAIWQVNLGIAYGNPGWITSSLPAIPVPPSNCNLSSSCTLQIQVITDGVASNKASLVLPSNSTPATITSGGYVAYWNAIGISASGLTPNLTVEITNAAGQSLVLPSSLVALGSPLNGFSFILPSLAQYPYSYICKNGVLGNCLTVKVIQNGVASNSYDVSMGNSFPNYVTNAGYSSTYTAIWAIFNSSPYGSRLFFTNPSSGAITELSYAYDGNLGLSSAAIPGAYTFACTTQSGTCVRFQIVSSAGVPSNVTEVKIY